MTKCPSNGEPCTKQLCALWMKGSCRVLDEFNDILRATQIDEVLNQRPELTMNLIVKLIPDTSTENLHEVYNNLDELHEILQKELFERM